jgi:hypothetical protein
MAAQDNNPDGNPHNNLFDIARGQPRRQFFLNESISFFAFDHEKTNVSFFLPFLN